jgi:DNA-binding NarL/FixJ family response regulator
MYWRRCATPPIGSNPIRPQAASPTRIAARRIAAIAPAVRTICYTAADEEPFASQFLQAGGKAYITKVAPPEEFLVAVERVLAGGRYVDHEMAQKMAINKVERRGDGCCFDRLSLREFEVARRIVGGQSNPEICAALHITPSTLSTHRRRIWGKLHVARDVELVHLARRCGLLGAEPAPEVERLHAAR